MYDDNNWTPATGDELVGFLEQINPVDGRLRTNPAQTQVAWRALPFYDEVVLIRVRDASWTPRNINIYYLTMKGNLYRLNGTSPPIHEVNAQAPIKITEENVIEYLKFFCFFVRGEEGPFLIAESMDDADIPKNMDPQTKAVMEGVLRPATYEGKNEKGEFLCDGVVFYSNALFLANFSVQPGGMIEMLNDEPVAGELPIRVDVPVA